MTVAVVHCPGLDCDRRHPYGPPEPVYDAVEALLAELGLDASRSGTPEWNPLGIIAGEGAGPLSAPPVRAGFLVAGCDPVRVDAECAKLMGFSPERIPRIERASSAPLLSTSSLHGVRKGEAQSHRFRPPGSWPSLCSSSRRTNLEG